LPSHPGHPGCWWSLTPPFHPDPALRPGGLFSVALSRGSLRVGVTHHLALRSPDFPRPLRAAVTRPTRPRGSVGVGEEAGAFEEPLPVAAPATCRRVVTSRSRSLTPRRATQGTVSTSEPVWVTTRSHWQPDYDAAHHHVGLSLRRIRTGTV